MNLLQINFNVISLIKCLVLSGLFFLNISYSQDDLDLSVKIKPVDSTNMFLLDSFYTWCGSAVKGEDGKYHLFYSRWPHADKKLDDDSMNYIFNGFSGWQKYSEIAHAVSDKITGPYKHVNVVLKGSRKEGDWKRFFMHNPMITKFDGKYYLYFISNAFDSNYVVNKTVTRQNLRWFQYNCTQKIGVIIADKIEDFVTGNFQFPEKFIMEPDGVARLEITNNPTVTKGPDNKFYMMFKSRISPLGHMTMWMAKADKPTGPFAVISPVFTESDYAAEDACMWYDKNRKIFYAVVKNFSNSNKLNNQFGSVALISSVDGIKWKPATHSMVTPREILWKDGRKIELARLERPFIYLDEKGEPAVLFAAFSKPTPQGVNISKLGKEHNTGNISIPLK